MTLNLGSCLVPWFPQHTVTETHTRFEHALKKKNAAKHNCCMSGRHQPQKWSSKEGITKIIQSSDSLLQKLH